MHTAWEEIAVHLLSDLADARGAEFDSGTMDWIQRSSLLDELTAGMAREGPPVYVSWVLVCISVKYKYKYKYKI
jgi:hypothetical protein